MAPTTPDTLVLNGQPLSWARACEAMSPLGRRENLVAAGGMLLKAALVGDALHLRIQPNFIEGQRTYHYDMPMPPGAGPALRGDLNANGSVALLFESGALSAGKSILSRTCRALAAALLAAGLSRSAPLTAVSGQGLLEAGAVAHPPATLGELADGG